MLSFFSLSLSPHSSRSIVLPPHDINPRSRHFNSVSFFYFFNYFCTTATMSMANGRRNENFYSTESRSGCEGALYIIQKAIFRGETILLKNMIKKKATARKGLVCCCIVTFSIACLGKRINSSAAAAAAL